MLLIRSQSKHPEWGETAGDTHQAWEGWRTNWAEQLTAPRLKWGREMAFQAICRQTQSTWCIWASEELLRLPHWQQLGKREVLGDRNSRMCCKKNLGATRYRLQDTAWPPPLWSAIEPHSDSGGLTSRNGEPGRGTDSNGKCLTMANVRSGTWGLIHAKPKGIIKQKHIRFKFTSW